MRRHCGPSIVVVAHTSDNAFVHHLNHARVTAGPRISTAAPVCICCHQSTCLLHGCPKNDKNTQSKSGSFAAMPKSQPKGDGQSKAISPKKDAKAPKSGRGKLMLFLLVLGAVFLYKVSSGNPTQTVGRLLQVMWKGMPGREDAAKFEKAYTNVGSNDQHSAYDGNVADSFYNLASDFYEYGWGDSFHFGFRRWHEPHRMAIANSQNWVATQLHVKDNDRVLDMGCGVGGPLRGIIRATGANVTGVTINQHQVDRGYEICSKEPPFVRERCHFHRSDYLKVQRGASSHSLL